MISPSALKEIKHFLEKAHNPLFLFDDDNDGLCSFLLLHSYAGRGGGLQIKTNPELTTSILTRVRNYHASIIVILDKPLVCQDFIDGVNVPVMWIDHHEPAIRARVHYYNPKLDGSADDSSTTYWCYRAVGGALWIAIIGAVSDWTLPDYFTAFKKEYPDLVDNEATPRDILYKTKLGRLCKIFSFLNKEDHSEFQEILKILLKIKSPYEILNEENTYGKDIMKRIGPIEKRYNSLLADALKTKKEGNMVVFTYGGVKTSFSADLSNELLYCMPGSFIIVAREKGDMMVMSLRSDVFEVKTVLKKALENVDGYGGGHPYACGAGISKEHFIKFLEIIKKEINM